MADRTLRRVREIRGTAPLSAMAADDRRRRSEARRQPAQRLVSVVTVRKTVTRREGGDAGAGCRARRGGSVQPCHGGAELLEDQRARGAVLDAGRSAAAPAGR